MKFYYYKIFNIKNGGFYIGITTNFEKRKKQHFNQLANHSHINYKMQNDYDEFGKDVFQIEIIETLETDEQTAYQHEYDLIQKFQATQSYNILEGGKLNPVYSPQVVNKLKLSHQIKYNDIKQYSFDGKHFTLINVYHGLRDATRDGQHDFRAIQKSIKSAQAHHNYYWVEKTKEQEWLDTFLKRFKCCVAKLNEESGEIEDCALTIQEFADKYNTTYDRIYASLRQNNRCERKYKFIRITAQQFADIVNLTL